MFLDHEDTILSNTESNNIYEPKSSEPQHSTRNMAVQVTGWDIFITFLSMIDIQPKLVTMTGILTFELLNKVCEVFTTNFSDKRIHNLNVKERIVLVFIKLKYAVLAILLKNISFSSCRQIYLSTLPLIRSILKHCKYWQTKN